MMKLNVMHHENETGWLDITHSLQSKIASTGKDLSMRLIGVLPRHSRLIRLFFSGLSGGNEATRKSHQSELESPM